jgi:hypothetical protein
VNTVLTYSNFRSLLETVARMAAVTHFCTLFDTRYVARGLAMLESLETHFAGEKTITILAMDATTPSMIQKIGKPHWKVISVEQLGDAELLEVKRNRPHREFCWTCAPALVTRMVESHAEREVVVYVDADLYFYSSPQLLLDELGSSGNILIHEHRYSADRRHYESSSGRFNVGFVAFVVGDEAKACVNRWRRQVLDKCVLDPDNGYCGDQGYLNEWPERYSGLRILRNIGGGVAPWNLLSYKVAGNVKQPSVDGVPVVFFHYHAFRTVSVRFLGNIAAIPAWGYEFSREAQHLLFSRYSRKLRRMSNKAARFGFKVDSDMEHPLREGARALLRRNLIFSI